LRVSLSFAIGGYGVTQHFSVALFLLFAFGAGNTASTQPETRPDVCTQTQVIRIPVHTQSAQETAEAVGGDPADLMISPGAPEEPPEGPSAFDVLEDGSFLISDPLRHRISVFDAQGKFRQVWKIGFAADRITVLPNNFVSVREASTGELHVFDREGQPRPAEKALPPEPAEIHVLTGKKATIKRPPNGSSKGDLLEVLFDRPGLTLVSVESLATDRDGNTYVTLESTANSGVTEGITVNKYVRKYAADGKLVCEIASIPLDYYVTPIDDLRVHNNIVYQLVTTSTEVRINEWGMN
jgi:hypothetical protein